MSVKSELLFELIKQKLTINEICEQLQLSRKQIYYILRMMEDKGFEFNRQYYDNGDIIYTPKTIITQNNQKNYVDIITKNSNTLRAVAISDLHIGNKKQRLDAIDKIYDYCVKEGIHIIFICGDLIDGTYGKGDKLIKNPEQQIEFVLNKYPYDHSILNIAVLGDHDYSVAESASQNLAVALKNYRHDIIPIGFGLGEININKGKIVLMHKFGYKYQKEFDKMVSIKNLHNDLILQGHYHSPFRIQYINTNYFVTIPTLSDIRDFASEPFPGAVLIEREVLNNHFSRVNFNNMSINDKVIVDEKCESIKFKTKGFSKRFF